MAKQLGIVPYVIGLKDKGLRKADRIEGRLLGRFRLGTIKLKKYATDDTNELVKELAQFPNGRHDDLCLIAGTKIATISGNKNIENVKVGEYVITPLGLKKVLVSKMTGFEEVFSWNGLGGTKNHPVFIHNKGFTSLDTLQYTDRYNKLCLSTLIQWMFRKVWYSMESPIKEWEGKESIIFLSQKVTKEDEILKVFMSLFGNILQERNAIKISIFIIKTVIHSIMTLLIWNVYRLGNIIQCLKDWTKRQLKEIWIELDHWQQFGIKAKKGWNGIKSMVKNLGIIENKLELNVSGAENYFGGGLRKEQGFVLQNVPHIIGERKIQKSGKQFNKEEKKKSVYNLTIEDAHCYYANGILVGNCDSLQYIHEIAYAPDQQLPKQPTTVREIIQADIKSAYERFNQRESGGTLDAI
jgi:hypothetical protein